MTADVLKRALAADPSKRIVVVAGSGVGAIDALRGRPQVQYCDDFKRGNLPPLDGKTVFVMFVGDGINPLAFGQIKRAAEQRGIQVMNYGNANLNIALSFLGNVFPDLHPEAPRGESTLGTSKGNGQGKLNGPSLETGEPLPPPRTRGKAGVLKPFVLAHADFNARNVTEHIRGLLAKANSLGIRTTQASLTCTFYACRKARRTVPAEEPARMVPLETPRHVVSGKKPEAAPRAKPGRGSRTDASVGEMAILVRALKRDFTGFLSLTRRLSVAALRASSLVRKNKELTEENSALRKAVRAEAKRFRNIVMGKR
ncbi:MAG: hypothetical protein HY435_00555 [Candidatus Liptonbacteria bacterium]|nr:hypothetical protein [Candidatus Liptonbacteria bacterium]